MVYQTKKGGALAIHADSGGFPCHTETHIVCINPEDLCQPGFTPRPLWQLDPAPQGTQVANPQSPEAGPDPEELQ